MPRPEADSQRPAARHVRDRRRRTLRQSVLTAALGVVVFLGSFAGLAYANLQGNIDRHDLEDYLGTDRPTPPGQDEPPGDPRDGEPINILVLGSDERVEDPAGNMRSDTTMILHISADRSRVEIVSIPRDTLVDLPACDLPDGGQTPAEQNAMFNKAFFNGGQSGDTAAAAACTIRTVEAWTDIYIDDFVVVDFDGFEAVVDSLGGVPMYIEDDIDDPRAHLSLEAGCQVLGGPDALGYARARYDVPGSDGSDIDRIGRQQELVAAIVREALSDRLLTNPRALYQFLDASTKTLTTSSWVGQLTNMAGVATSLRSIDEEGVRFATMPHAPQGNRVVPTAEADAMWDNLRNDRPIDADIDGTGDEPRPQRGPGPDGEVTPEQPAPEETAPAQPEETPAPECTR